MFTDNALIEQFKTKLIENGFVGDIHTDYPTRLLNATDNSIYELVPEAVIQPMHAQDIERIIKLANQEPFTKLAFAPRGGGTGTNGQSLSNKIIIDFSRHMTRILDFNPEQKTITVEPGIILADLNRFLAKHGLFFAPDVSTANRATIGGMIATDAAGKGSLIYGKTADHISSLNLVLADGGLISTENLATDKLKQVFDQNDRVAKLYKQIISYLEPVQDEIKLRFPPLKRPLSGYNIRQCYQGGSFDLSRLICGSEGTLGLVTRATLKLLPIPKYKTLVVIHYDSFIHALKDAQFLIKYKPLAIEAVDEKVQKSAQTLPNWPMLAKMLNSVDKNYVSNFMELVDDDKDILEQRVSQLKTDLDALHANYVVITDVSQIAQLWSIRSLAVGLAGKMPGEQKPVAFVEDAIVPPEHLADFVSDLQDMLANKKLNYAMYGHVDVGCIHVRPALNLQNEPDRQKIRPITEEFISLLNKYNGILWGEHGKGFRGEFVPDVFGPILYPVLCQIKALFDPDNRFNSGKLAAPDSSLKLTRIEQVPMRGQLDEHISKPMQQRYTGAMLCNGNGACFNQEPSNVMCPSYKVTKDRIHSPKGRAMLVKEWMREKSKPNGRHREMAKMALDAMNGCLGCKGCAGKCPTQVSIPDLRTSFLNIYHQEYKRRSMGELVNGYIEHVLPILAKFPRTWNFLSQYKLIPRFGMSDLPTFNSNKTLLSQLKQQNIAIYSDVTQIANFGANPVVVYADAFTGLLEQKVLLAFIHTVKQLGMSPYIIYPIPSGKALIVGGMINHFRKNAAKLKELFTPIMEASIPIVSLENTVALMFRDEMNKFAEPLNAKILTVAEFMSANIDKLSNIKINANYQLLPHCTEQAVHPQEAIHWKSIFKQVGSNLEVQNVGCCGMAGTYGYQTEHQQNSRDLFAMHWEQSVTNTDNVLATGFSCRSQSKKLAGKELSHPIEIIAASL